MALLVISFAVLSHVALSMSLPTTTTQKPNYYALTALEQDETIPANGIEIHPEAGHNLPADHILRKKIVAVRLDDLHAQSKVLTNADGHAVLATAVDDSNESSTKGEDMIDGDGDEDMKTAESSIVFRPLFAYRRQQAKRRRFYVPSNYNGGNGGYVMQKPTRQQPQRPVRSEQQQYFYVDSCNRRQYPAGSQEVASQPQRPSRRREVYSDSFGSYYPSWYVNAKFPAFT